MFTHETDNTTVLRSTVFPQHVHSVTMIPLQQYHDPEEQRARVVFAKFGDGRGRSKQSSAAEFGLHSLGPLLFTQKQEPKVMVVVGCAWESWGGFCRTQKRRSDDLR